LIETNALPHSQAGCGLWFEGVFFLLEDWLQTISRWLLVTDCDCPTRFTSPPI